MSNKKKLQGTVTMMRAVGSMKKFLKLPVQTEAKGAQEMHGVSYSEITKHFMEGMDAVDSDTEMVDVN